MFKIGKLIQQRIESHFCRKMSSTLAIATKNQEMQATLNGLKEELQCIRKELIARKKKQLLIENAQLKIDIEAARVSLVSLERLRGREQIRIPNESHEHIKAEVEEIKVDTPKEPAESKKQKKVKEAGDNAAKPKKTVEPPAREVVDVSRLDFRIGKIVEVSKHPEADSLYLEKIDCGEGAPRTVISGLVKFVPIEEMKDRIVVVLCNLKPAKMRGILSEAMVMCASTPEKVEVLDPPKGALPGDLVHCEGYERNPDAVLNPKKKVFETCAPDLHTNDNLVCCYKHAPLIVPGKGEIKSQTLKNVPVK